MENEIEEEENNADFENETENPREEKKFWQVQTCQNQKTNKIRTNKTKGPKQRNKRKRSYNPRTIYIILRSSFQLKRKTKKKENWQQLIRIMTVNDTLKILRANWQHWQHWQTNKIITT